jgi:hypothetical protein
MDAVVPWAKSHWAVVGLAATFAVCIVLSICWGNLTLLVTSFVMIFLAGAAYFAYCPHSRRPVAGCETEVQVGDDSATGNACDEPGGAPEPSVYAASDVVSPPVKPRPAVLVADPARGVLVRAAHRKRTVVLASAPDPAQLELDRARRKRQGKPSRRAAAMNASSDQGSKQGSKPGSVQLAAAGGRASRQAVKFSFTGAKPTSAVRPMPREDPAKTPSENAAVHMMYRGRTMPQPASARRELVRGMMRDFPFRAAGGMVLASGHGR